MSLECFECFKLLLLSINEKLKFLYKIASNRNTTYVHNVYGGIQSISYNCDENKDSVFDFEYQCTIVPKYIEGINLLWNLVFKANNEQVSEKTIDLLTKLYMNLTQEIEKSIYDIR